MLEFRIWEAHCLKKTEGDSACDFDLGSSTYDTSRGTVLAMCDSDSSHCLKKNLRGRCLQFAIGAPQLMTHLGGTVLANCDLGSSLSAKIGGRVLAICDLGSSLSKKN